MKKVRDATLWVVIPAFNEAGAIGEVIASVPATVKAGTTHFATRVIVVDDHSHDKTATIARKHGATVLRHIINSGVGAATRTGLRYVMKNHRPDDFTVTIDADGQHTATDITHMLQHAVSINAAVVIGNRLHAGNAKHMPLHRTVGNKCAAIFSRLLFGIKIEDTQSGLRLFHASALPIVADYTIDRYGFSTELLWLATRRGLVMSEAPINVIYSKETLAKGQKNWGAIDVITDLLWVRMSR